MTGSASPLADCAGPGPALARAVETDRIYFEMGAEIEPLDRATLAWMPGLTASAAGAVIHRVDPDAIAERGAAWIDMAEQALSSAGAILARIYLDDPHEDAGRMLRRAGYVERDELVFVHELPDPSPDLSFVPVGSEQDWADKLRFHQEVEETPDGHGNRATDWVALERRKCAAGMDAYLALKDGEIVGAVGAIWGDGIVRAKNLVVHPGHRRRTVGKALLCHVAALGRKRGVPQQCVMAVRGEQGERLYRAAGMEMVGLQVEWSKPLGGAQ